MPSWRPPLNIGPLPIDPATADLLIAVFVLAGIIGLGMMVAGLRRQRGKLRQPGEGTEPCCRRM